MLNTYAHFGFFPIAFFLFIGEWFIPVRTLVNLVLHADLFKCLRNRSPA